MVGRFTPPYIIYYLHGVVSEKCWKQNVVNQRGYKLIVVHIFMAHTLAASLPCHQGRLWHIILLQFAMTTHLRCQRNQLNPLREFCKYVTYGSIYKGTSFSYKSVGHLWYLFSVGIIHSQFQVPSYQPSLVESILFCWSVLHS